MGRENRSQRQQHFQRVNPRIWWVSKTKNKGYGIATLFTHSSPDLLYLLLFQIEISIKEKKRPVRSQVLGQALSGSFNLWVPAGLPFTQEGFYLTGSPASPLLPRTLHNQIHGKYLWPTCSWPILSRLQARWRQVCHLVHGCVPGALGKRNNQLDLPNSPGHPSFRRKQGGCYAPDSQQGQANSLVLVSCSVPTALRSREQRG